MLVVHVTSVQVAIIHYNHSTNLKLVLIVVMTRPPTESISLFLSPVRKTVLPIQAVGDEEVVHEELIVVLIIVVEEDLDRALASFLV